MKGYEQPQGKSLSLNVRYDDEVITFYSVTASPKALGYILEVKQPRWGEVYEEQWIYLMKSVSDLTPQTPELLAKDNRMRLYRYGDDYLFFARAAKQRK